MRLNAEQFEKLLSKIGPLIQRSDKVRKSIEHKTRLILKLRFYATGSSFSSLQYLFRIPKNTRSGIIPDTGRAIYNALEAEYMKVRIISETQ